jgi:ADP-heptose:LPS heptosyltransferase
MRDAKRKIRVDRLIGKPISWVLNTAARLLGRLLRRDHSITPQNVRTIAISKYVGMGSIIQATPLIRSLRRTYPEATIIFVTGVGSRRMVERLDDIDRIITVDDGNMVSLARTTLRAIAQLIRARVDLYLDLEVYSAYASIISLTSLARNRLGFFRVSAEHKRGNYTHLMYFNPRSPIRYIYLQLGRLAGCDPDGPAHLGRIRIFESDREEVAGRLRYVAAASRGYFVVNANASDLLIERRWPVERFAELIERLLTRYDMAVVLIGAPGERAYVTELADRVGLDRDRLVNLAGELSLGGLFALLDGARCVVTNDTGPMHMALALETPTVALFGPGDPSHYGWAAPWVRIVYKPIYCSPCLYEASEPPCQGNNVCMRRITVEDVLEAAEQVLNPSDTEACGEGLPRSFFGEPRQAPLGCIVRPTSGRPAPSTATGMRLPIVSEPCEVDPAASRT